MELFIELRETLEGELQRTGFKQPSGPPMEEPEIPRRLRELRIDALVDLLDDFQSFYNYLSDEITRVLTFEGITKAQVDLQYALAKKEVSLDKNLTNEAARTMAVETDLTYLTAVRDHLYFKQSHAQLEERRRKISKSIERLYRELLYRDQLANQRPQHYGNHPNRAPMPVPRAGKEKPDEVRTVQYQERVPSEVNGPAAKRKQDVHQDQKRTGSVKGNEGVSGEGVGRVVAPDPPELSDTGPKPTSPFNYRSLFALPVQLRVPKDNPEPVQEEGRVKPRKGSGRPDSDDYWGG